MKYLSGCLSCGADLIYLPQHEAQSCLYCGKTFESNARCSQGHFVCDAGHSADAGSLIEQFCTETRLKDPVEIAFTLMRHLSIAMHGPEHHFLVPAVLLAAYDNQHGLGNRLVKIQQARKRADGVRGGSWGLCGNCGAAVGTGIFVSLITGATLLSKHEWQLSNRMTAESLLVIAEHGGPRCCAQLPLTQVEISRAPHGRTISNLVGHEQSKPSWQNPFFIIPNKRVRLHFGFATTGSHNPSLHIMPST